MEHSAPSTTQIDDAIVQEIAREASADPRSVVRRLAGLPVRGLAGERIDRALARRAAALANPEPNKAA
jgi:hypothetical protein